MFIGIFSFLEPAILNYYSSVARTEEKKYENGGKKPGPARKLTKYEECTLTLIRLRHAAPIVILADLFYISNS